MNILDKTALRNMWPVLQAMWVNERDTTLPGSRRLRAWWQACRPPFFIADLIPVGAGLLLALREPTIPTQIWLRLALVLAGCFCVHTIANIANDLFDHILGVDDEDSIGGSRVIQEGLISPREITVAILLLTLGGTGCALTLLTLSGQWWLVGPLVLALLSAVFYVAPPIRYGHRGYGELSVALNMGFLMVSGTHAVLTSDFSAQSLAFGLPVGLMVAGILFYQSLPEIETDRMARKFTLAVHMGKSRAQLLFLLWWPAVWVLLLNLWACGLVGWPVLLCLCTIPLYLRTCRHIAEARRLDDWLPLDAHGHLVRKLYLSNGLLLMAGIFCW